MPNATTEHSRALRARTATTYNARKIAEGYRRLNILISPRAVARLATLAEQHGSKSAAIEAILQTPDPIQN